MPIDFKRILRTALSSKAIIREFNSIYLLLHFIGILAFTSTAVYHAFVGGEPTRPISAAFIQLIATNVFSGYLLAKRKASGKEFLYTFLIFALEITVCIFLLFPQRAGEDAPDILFMLTLPPLAGLFTLINYKLVKFINKV